MRAVEVGILLLLAAFGVTACGQEQPPTARPLGPGVASPPPNKPLPAPYRVIEAQPTWGAIEGTVILGQALPISRVVPTKELQELSWRERASDILAYDPERLTLADAVVFLPEVEAGKDWPEGLRGKSPSIPLMLQDGVWTPHVQWSRPGGVVALTNGQKEVQVNARLCRYSFDDPNECAVQLNVMLGAGTTLAGFDEGSLRRVGRYALFLDCCFEFATAHVLVFGHPYVAGPTALDGAFQIESVPPGTYELVAWHGPVRLEQPPDKVARVVGGPLTSAQTVTVAPGAKVKVQFTLVP